MNALKDLFSQDLETEVEVTLTINELRCLLGAAARDEAHQATRVNRCQKGSDTYYEADYFRSSSEIAVKAIYRLIGWDK